MKLEDLYNKIKNLAFCRQELYYISLIDSQFNNYNTDNAQALINEIVRVYTSDLNFISANISNRPVLLDEQALAYYEQVDDSVILQDLEYLRRCLIAIGSAKCGFLDDLSLIADQLDI